MSTKKGYFLLKMEIKDFFCFFSGSLRKLSAEMSFSSASERAEEKSEFSGSFFEISRRISTAFLKFSFAFSVFPTERWIEPLFMWL